MQDRRTDDRTVVCPYLAYKYRQTDGSIRVVRLPIVQVYLKSATTDTETIGLVDTGATRTLLPRELAEILSLTYSERPVNTVGAGGTFPCRVTKLERLVLKKNVTSFCTLAGIDVLVPEQEGILPYLVLGRDHVFTRFDITFHERRQKMTFTQV